MSQQVLATFARRIDSERRQARYQVCDRLELRSGWGIAGDRHAGWGNPRQVLLVDRAALDRYHLQPGDLGENIVLDLNGLDLAQYQSGQVLQLGTQAQVRLMFACEPCNWLARLQPNLRQQIGRARGFLALVTQGGIVQPGDEIHVCPIAFPPLSDRAGERFPEFVARIPTGRVVTTADLLLALGCDRSYYRVIPAWIKKAPPDLPVHRIVTKDQRLLLKHLPNQAQQLRAEGICVQDDRVETGDRWAAQQFHPISLK